MNSNDTPFEDCAALIISAVVEAFDLITVAESDNAARAAIAATLKYYFVPRPERMRTDA